MKVIKKKSFIFRIALFCYILFYHNIISFSQNQYQRDSLTSLLKTKNDDTNKIITLNILGRQFWLTGDYEEAKQYSQKALLLSRKLNYTSGEANAHNTLGNIYWNKGNYSEALKSHFKALSFREEIGDLKGIANSLNNIGLIYWNQGNYPHAMEYHFRALKLREKIGDKDGSATSLNNIGLIYYQQGNYALALEYYFKSVKIKESSGDSAGLATLYMNIANIYDDQQNFSNAFYYHLKALKIRTEIGDKTGIATSLNNLGINFFIQHNYSSALNYFNQALEIEREIGNKQEMANSLNNIGQIYYKQKQFKKALDYCQKSLVLAREVGELDFVKEAEKSLAEIYEYMNQNTNALKHYKAYISARDSLLNKENTQNTQKQQIKYEFDKKEAVLKEQQKKERAIAIEKNKKQKIIIWTVVGGMLLVLVFAGLMFNRWKITRNQKRIIASQKKLVDEKQLEIISSITYAKRLQQAILPPVDYIKKHLPQSFLIYKPKDIVAGDFYWIEIIDNVIFIAVADCTGHGVPGAMVSVVCSNALNRTVKEFALRDTGKILDKVTDLVLETFEKSGEQIKDGMDISLLSYNKSSKQIHWSGANNPLWYIQNGQIREVKANKQPIGKFDIRNPFTTHTIEYADNTTFYLFTDGLPDQFGGPKGKKFMYKRFENNLADICKLPMDEQRDILEKAFSEWKGNLEQVDDVTVIGIRI